MIIKETRVVVMCSLIVIGLMQSKTNNGRLGSIMSTGDHSLAGKGVESLLSMLGAGE